MSPSDGPYTEYPQMVVPNYYWSELFPATRISRKKRMKWYKNRGHLVSVGTIGVPWVVPQIDVGSPHYLLCDGAPVELKVTRTTDNCTHVQTHFIGNEPRVTVDIVFKGNKITVDNSCTAKTCREIETIEFKRTVGCTYKIVKVFDVIAQLRNPEMTGQPPIGTPWAVRLTSTHISPITYKPYDGWVCSCCSASFLTAEELCGHMNVPFSFDKLCSISKDGCTHVTTALPVGKKPLPSRWGYAINGQFLRDKLQRIKSSQTAHNSFRRRSYSQPSQLRLGPVY